jgi:plastocyanin
MNVEANKMSVFARQPLSALGKTAVAALVGMVILCGIMSIFSGTLLVITVIALVCTLLVATGIRWTPLLGGIMSGYILYVFLIQVAYPVYHLVHPKDALSNPWISFVLFVIILLVVWCSVVALGTSIGTLVQNYRQGERRRPRWLTPALTGMAGVLVGAILIAAISQPGATAATTGTTSTNGMPTVHLGISSFSQSTVTVPKGSKLLLVDDGSFVHILANGSWVNGTPRPAAEPGGPTVNSLQIHAGNVEIGPFNITGTYHLYCQVHQGMNLVIIVQ